MSGIERRIAFVAANRFEYLEFLEMMRSLKESDLCDVHLIIYRENRQTDLSFPSSFFRYLEFPTRFIDKRNLYLIEDQYAAILAANYNHCSTFCDFAKMVLLQYSSDSNGGNDQEGNVQLILTKAQSTAKDPKNQCCLKLRPRLLPIIESKLGPQTTDFYRSFLKRNKRTILLILHSGNKSSDAQNKLKKSLEENFNIVEIAENLYDECLYVNSHRVSPVKNRSHEDELLHAYYLADFIVTTSKAVYDDAVLLNIKALRIAAGDTNLNTTELRFVESNINLTNQEQSQDQDLMIEIPKIIEVTFSNLDNSTNPFSAQAPLDLKDAELTRNEVHGYIQKLLSSYSKTNIEKNSLANNRPPLQLLDRMAEPKKSRLVKFFDRLPVRLIKLICPKKHRLKFFNVVSVLLKKNQNFKHTHSLLIINAKGIEKLLEKSDVRDHFSTIPPQELAVLMLESNLMIDLGILVEHWHELSIQAKKSSFYAFEKAADRVLYPPDILLDSRQRLIDRLSDATSLDVDALFLASNGYFSAAERLRVLSPVEKANVQLELNYQKQRLGPLFEVIELASLNSISPSESHIYVHQGKRFLRSELDQPIVIIELAITRLFLAKSKQEDFERTVTSLLKFYGHILAALEDNSLAYLPVMQAGVSFPWSDRSLTTLSYHTIGGHSKQFHAKESALFGYMSIDSGGFSGWASISDSSPELINKINALDPTEARVIWTKLYDKFVTNNISKYKQLASQEINGLPEKFVFYPMQVTSDMVAEMAHIDTLTLLKNLPDQCAELGLHLVIKRHPKCKNKLVQQELENLAARPNVSISNASIHSIIPKAVATVTVNSGVGFESLLHLKPVIITGKADYAAGCREVHNLEALKNALKSILISPNDILFIQKFLLFYVGYFLVDVDSRDQIEQRILGILAPQTKGGTISCI